MYSFKSGFAAVLLVNSLFVSWIEISRWSSEKLIIVGRMFFSCEFSNLLHFLLHCTQTGFGEVERIRMLGIHFGAKNLPAAYFIRVRSRGVPLICAENANHSMNWICSSIDLTAYVCFIVQMYTNLSIRIAFVHRDLLPTFVIIIEESSAWTTLSF